MEQYQIVGKIGEGSYALVWRARSKRDGKAVAVKQLKGSFGSWDECLSLSEVKVLPNINHPNIIKLFEVVREKQTVYLIFELCDSNLYQTMQGMREEGKQFSEEQIRYVIGEIIKGLAFLHEKDIAHRDIKPENIMMIKTEIKISDFGQSRVTKPKVMSEYVATRWYRAPEILLGSHDYTTTVDMWALGATMAELYLLHPLFPGTSDVDQIFKICTVLGTPNHWQEGKRLCANKGMNFPTVVRTGVMCLIPKASSYAVDMIERMVDWNPAARLTAQSARKHQFLSSGNVVPVMGCSISMNSPQDHAFDSSTIGMSEFDQKLHFNDDVLDDLPNNTSEVPGDHEFSFHSLLSGNHSMHASNSLHMTNDEPLKPKATQNLPLSRLNPGGRVSMLDKLLHSDVKGHSGVDLEPGESVQTGNIFQEHTHTTKSKPIFLQEPVGASVKNNDDDDDEEEEEDLAVGPLPSYAASSSSSTTISHGRRAQHRRAQASMLPSSLSIEHQTIATTTTDTSPSYGRRAKK